MATEPDDFDANAADLLELENELSFQQAILSSYDDLPGDFTADKLETKLAITALKNKIIAAQTAQNKRE
jgi:hypothetical protein